MSSTAGPSAVTPTSTLSLLTNLPLSHPSYENLLVNHSPLAYPSILPSQQVNKLVGRINAAILARDNESDRRVSWRISKKIILQDTEGYALTNWGKGWLNAALTAVTTSGAPFSTIIDPLHLLSTIVTHSSSYPAFEREAIHPIMGKVALTLSRLLERCLAENQSDWNDLVDLIDTTKAILEHSPASFRPLASNIRTALRTIGLCLPVSPADPSTSAPQIIIAPLEARQSAAELIAALPYTAGKAQSSAAWGVAVREAIGGVSQAIDGIARDGWEEEPVKIVPPAAPALLALPVEPSARLVASLDRLEGFTEEISALLRFTSVRNVPLPIAQLVAMALRCLNITLDTPFVSYISPQHQAALLSSLPRIWTSGILLIGSIAASCGDHLLPHLSSILDHTVWLTERTPESMVDVHLQLLNFHRYLFDLYPPACSPADYPSRLLRSCLSRYSILLDSKPSLGMSVANGTGGGKRGKKRARGAEDSLVGGLEGREAQAVTHETVKAIIASLQLASMLHTTPLLSPSLLTFSIRLHLSLHLHLGSASKTIFNNASHLSQLQDGVAEVLQQALYLTEGEQGSQRGWKSAILSVLTDERTSILLHPSLPPTYRPHPPLNALHYFAKETEEERRLRRELGYSTAEDMASAQDEDGDDDMQVDAPVAEVSGETYIEKTSTRISAVPVVAPAQPLTSALPTRTAPVVPIPPSQPIAAPTPSVVEPIAATATTNLETAPTSTPPTHDATPFMSTPVADKGKAKVVEQFVERTTTVASSTLDDDDEPLPELDSGSSDEEEDEEDEDEEIDQD